MKTNNFNSSLDDYRNYSLVKNPLKDNKYSCDNLSYIFFGERSNLVLQTDSENSIQKKSVFIPKALDKKFLGLLKKHFGAPDEIYTIEEPTSSKLIKVPEYSVKINEREGRHTTINNSPNRLVWRQNDHVFEVTIDYNKSYSKLVFSKLELLIPIKSCFQENNRPLNNFYQDLVIRLIFLLLFFVISCDNPNKTAIDSNFLCDYLESNDQIDLRVLGSPPSLEEFQKGIKRKHVSRDSLEPLVVHLWDGVINPNTFDFLVKLDDSLDISYSELNKIVLNKKSLLKSSCKYYKFKSIDSLPRNRTYNKTFFTKPSPSILVQLSDLYIDKRGEYGVVHFVHTNGFLDNTYSSVIFFKKENGVWKLME